MNIDIEKEFDACVESIGGIKVSNMFEQPPQFDNADYLFSKHNVIAELKCLKDDKSADENTQKNLKEFYVSKWPNRSWLYLALVV
jgi:hypothetical protein